MKRFVVFLLFVSLLTFACNLSSTSTPPTITIAPPVTVPPATEPPTAAVPPAATEPPTATEPPAATQPPAPVTNVTCNELALYLDPALASGYGCKSVPEAIGQGFFDTPQYTELTFQGYLLSDRFHTPQIHIYPLQRFSQLAPDLVNSDVASLQALLSGGPQGDTLTLLNVSIFGAGQLFHAQYRVLPFGSGSGIRYLSEYAQYYDPVNNHDLFYTFQGLTSDGKYWISAILPISNPILPEDPRPLPGGQTDEQFSNNYPTYIVDMTNQLNSQTAASFSPSLTALDTLVGSIQIQP